VYPREEGACKDEEWGVPMVVEYIDMGEVAGVARRTGGGLCQGDGAKRGYFETWGWSLKRKRKSRKNLGGGNFKQG